jgi:pentatricopeptide repeat protein
VFTYTTMISQCGSHHQLRRALELVAEMRGRAIPLNVHTYSALLNVCLKANELDLALDIYAQMLAEGCAPNMVTYNTLVDIYGKIGKWADALGVLDLLQQQVRAARRRGALVLVCISGTAGSVCIAYSGLCHLDHLLAGSVLLAVLLQSSPFLNSTLPPLLPPPTPFWVPPTGHHAGDAHVQHHHQRLQPEPPLFGGHPGV